MSNLPATMLRWFSACVLFLISTVALAQATDPVDLTGLWQATTFYDVGAAQDSTENACISIEMEAKQVRVTTSHGSTWTGEFDAEKRVLTASYQRGHVSGRVILWLAQDSDQLEGEWFNHKGDSGRYVALRDCDEDTIISRLRRMFKI